MGYFIYAMLWIAAVVADALFIILQLPFAKDLWPGPPPFEALVIFNLLVIVLGPPEES